MAEQEQTQELKTLEERLVDIGNLKSLITGVQKLDDNKLRVNAYRTIAKILTKDSNSEISDEDERNRKREALYYSYYENIRVSPEEATRYALEGVASRVKSIEKLYEDNKESIVKTIVSSINGDLKKAKTKAEAGQILVEYLSGLDKLNAPEVDQSVLDRHANLEAAAQGGVSMHFGMKGNKKEFEGLYARGVALKYVKEEENKESGITSYKIDEEKFEELVKDVENAGLLYTNVKHVEFIKERDAAAVEAQRQAQSN